VLVLAELASCGPVDDLGPRHDLSCVSPAVRPLAERLLAASPHQRQAIWDQFLAGGAAHSLIMPAAPVPGCAPNVAISAPVPPNAPAQVPVGPTSERGVRMTRAVDFEPREIEWLWTGRVPLGMMTLFAGDPKLGKSYVTLTMAAALSRSLPLPMGELPNRPGSTILMSAEDDPARTIVPRLNAAGADLAKVHILESVILDDAHEALPTLRADVGAITAAATRLGDCRLIVIDPVSAYLKGVDDNRNAALRGVLTPLNKLAARLGAAVVLVSHLTKTSSSNGKHRVLGSIAYVGACRANHLFVADPHDPTGRRVLMLDNGGNVAPPAPTLAYVIEDRGHGPQVAWLDEPVPITVEEALRPRMAPYEDDDADETNECAKWLTQFLANGPRPSIEVFKEACGVGYSRHQVKRAKKRMRAVAQKQGFQDGAQWTWGLPANACS
jgi:putative DNA primase/helicase